MDLRCEGGKKYAELHDGVVQFKCSRPDCGAKPGVVVIHQFDALTGKPLETRVYRDADHKEGINHGAAHCTAVRSA